MKSLRKDWKASGELVKDDIKKINALLKGGRVACIEPGKDFFSIDKVIFQSGVNGRL